MKWRLIRMRRERVMSYERWLELPYNPELALERLCKGLGIPGPYMAPWGLPYG